MAFAERYVTQGAGGGGAGTSGDPWTLSEGFANAVAGDRVNIQSDAGYSSGALSVSNVGSLTQLIVFRGYNSSIGDLENLGRNSDGTLNTTNFPVITLTGAITPNTLVCFQNLNITGSIATTGIIYSTGVDNVQIISCKLLNSGNGYCIRLDNQCNLIDTDFECSGSSHNIVVDIDNQCLVVGCRFKGNEVSGTLLAMESSVIDSCAFLANSTSVGIELGAQFGGTRIIKNNTFYNLGTAITLANSATYTSILVLINNHVTDCGTYINNLYSATSTWAIIEMNERTRDNTTPRTGIGDGINIGEVIIDTGGPETDYVDAGNGDITLIPAAPGVDTGLGM